MIVSSLLDLASFFIQTLFSGFQIVSLPLDFMTVLLDIFCYGTWVIGADLMGITIATITGLLTLRFGIGLALFIWRLLPLT